MSNNVLKSIDTPMLALTGTADKGTSAAISSGLSLKKDKVELFVSPNRENLRISVIKTKKSDAFENLHWIVKMIQENGLECPKTLLFCNTTKDIAEVANYLLFKLGKDAYYPHDSKKMTDCVIGIYHSMTWQQYKERVVSSMKGSGKKRVIIATSALSMGVNFPDVRYVVHWGPARNLLDHHQQAGRAGRDGNRSDIVVIYHGQQLSHCEEDVKSFVRSDDCLRVASYRPFDGNVKPLDPHHFCCSNCIKICACGDNGCSLPPPLFLLKSVSPENETPERSRMLTLKDKDELRETLIELKEQFDGPSTLFACTGFSEELIEDIVEQSQFIFTLQDLTKSSPVFSLRHAIAVLEVFAEMFQDILGLEDLVTLLGQEFLLEESQPSHFAGIFDDLSDSDSLIDELDELDILT